MRRSLELYLFFLTVVVFNFLNIIKAKVLSMCFTRKFTDSPSQIDWDCSLLRKVGHFWSREISLWFHLCVPVELLIPKAFLHFKMVLVVGLLRFHFCSFNNLLIIDSLSSDFSLGMNDKSNL